MQRRDLNAPDAPLPVAAYTQAVEVSGATRMLYISGQVGQRMDGTFPDDIVEQSRLAWQNLEAQVKAAGMTLDNLVKVTTILPNQSDVAAAHGPGRPEAGEHADRRGPRQSGLEDRGRGHRCRLSDAIVLCIRLCLRSAKQAFSRPLAAFAGVVAMGGTVMGDSQLAIT